MPRDSNGVYSLPAGNPVVTLTTISTVWANTTLDDIALALTNSVDRQGTGGMSGPLKLSNGTVGAPALSWLTEPTSGLYRAAAGDFRYSISSNDVLTLTATGLTAAGTITSLRSLSAVWTDPRIIINETDAALNEKITDITSVAGVLLLRTRTDVDGAGANIFSLDRNGTALTSITYNASGGVHIFDGGNIRSDADNTRQLGINGNKWARLYAGDIRDADNFTMLDSTGTILRLAGTGQNWTEIRSGEHFNPGADNTLDLGSASLRWNQVFATELIDGTNSLVSSSGTTVSIANSATWTVVNFPNGVLQYAGREVGYRGANTNAQGGANYTLLQTDAGRVVYMTNGGATTLTVPVLTADTIITVVNNSNTNNCTLSQSSTTMILAGTTTTGNRTLGTRGVATLYYSATNVVFVSGAGVS